jgi:hypothetical protein
MDKELKVAALSLIALLAIVALVQPLISTVNNQPFSELAVLGPTSTVTATCNQNQTELGNYPRTVSPSFFVCLFGYVENHYGSAEYYEFLTKLGNESTQISNLTGANAPIIFTHNVLLLDNQSSIFPIGSAPNYTGSLIPNGETGTNLRLIFELWMYDKGTATFRYSGIFNEIWINVTTP